MKKGNGFVAMCQGKVKFQKRVVRGLEVISCEGLKVKGQKLEVKGQR